MAAYPPLSPFLSSPTPQPQAPTRATPPQTPPATLPSASLPAVEDGRNNLATEHISLLTRAQFMEHSRRDSKNGDDDGAAKDERQYLMFNDSEGGGKGKSLVFVKGERGFGVSFIVLFFFF